VTDGGARKADVEARDEKILPVVPEAFATAGDEMPVLPRSGHKLAARHGHRPRRRCRPLFPDAGVVALREDRGPETPYSAPGGGDAHDA